MTELSKEFEDFLVGSAGITGGIRKNRVRDVMNGVLLKIAGILWPVQFKHRLLERHGTVGQADFFNNNITIEGNLKPSETLSAIWHEMLEIMNKKYDLGMPHEVLCRMETHSFETLVNNPLFVEELWRYAKKYNGERDKKIKK